VAHIFIEDFVVKAKIGVYPREQILPQIMTLNLEIGLPDHQQISDDLSKTIDYSAVIEYIHGVIEDRHFNLVEYFATEIADGLIARFKAPWVRISAAKMGVIKGVKRIGVNIERGTRM
jgi:dihydroneopterin aldolase